MTADPSPAYTYRLIAGRLYRQRVDGSHVPLRTVHTVDGLTREEGDPLTREQVDALTKEKR